MAAEIPHSRIWKSIMAIDHSELKLYRGHGSEVKSEPDPGHVTVVTHVSAT